MQQSIEGLARQFQSVVRDIKELKKGKSSAAMEQRVGDNLGGFNSPHHQRTFDNVSTYGYHDLPVQNSHPFHEGGYQGRSPVFERNHPTNNSRAAPTFAVGFWMGALLNTTLTTNSRSYPTITGRSRDGFRLTALLGGRGHQRPHEEFRSNEAWHEDNLGVEEDGYPIEGQEYFGGHYGGHQVDKALKKIKWKGLPKKDDTSKVSFKDNPRHNIEEKDLNGWIEKDEEDCLEDLVYEKDSHVDEVIGDTSLEAEQDALSLVTIRTLTTQAIDEKSREKKMKSCKKINDQNKASAREEKRIVEQGSFKRNKVLSNPFLLHCKSMNGVQQRADENGLKQSDKDGKRCQMVTKREPTTDGRPPYCQGLAYWQQKSFR
ncbi:hypothetical protein M9H77_23238 [Catharanthus roseus]|uniref:Uncharacterized protein n=1 Tax=Catharanthus roseus TaxID=4058 RepID=A0ACC0AU97_CATRO|nr:hypothetical protein M9H77_23238 [Catharanthus roseus]